MIPSLRRCDGNPCEDFYECLMFGHLLSTTSVGRSDVRQTGMLIPLFMWSWLACRSCSQALTMPAFWRLAHI